jgi:putative ABC transport system substrate-binding protein
MGQASGQVQHAGPIPRVAFLKASGNLAYKEVFRQGLRDLGYVEGQNIIVDLREASGDNARLPMLAAELVSLRPDVIVTNGEPAIRAVKDAAGNIPIVMAVIGDPVAAGLAQTLGRPGGNLTGMSSLAKGLLGKRLELLNEVTLRGSCVTVLRNSGREKLDVIYWQEVAAAAETLQITLQPLAAGSASELEAVFAETNRQHCGALLVMPDPIFTTLRFRVVELAAHYRMPAIYDLRAFVEAGGLMSYGPDLADQYRRAALYVDKILKGANPGELPIEQPTKFELVVNLKTAKALGLTVPQSILARADEVIE